MQEHILYIRKKLNQLLRIKDKISHHNFISIIILFEKNVNSIIASQNNCQVRNKSKNAYSKN